jgi:hypothetical protein
VAVIVERRAVIVAEREGGERGHAPMVAAPAPPVNRVARMASERRIVGGVAGRPGQGGGVLADEVVDF